MVEKIKGKTFTVADLYTEAAKMAREELQSLKKRPLTSDEDIKMKELAKAISNTVLRDMKII